MDLNYLYGRHQVSLFHADNADCAEARLVHRTMADAYAAQISAAKQFHADSAGAAL